MILGVGCEIMALMSLDAHATNDTNDLMLVGIGMVLQEEVVFEE
jgi:hypothetical protein